MYNISFCSAEVVSISGWVTRGAGARTHHEYEVRVRLPATAWALLRRYRRFRDLYLAARALYGDKVTIITVSYVTDRHLISNTSTLS